jgi:hypothetical protein
MNVGKTLFAQIMEFVPWTSFGRIVDCYSGNAGVRRMTCAEQFRVMAFAQLTWRESLRDIEVTLGANATKLYAMGLRHSIHRSTLADANESRDWRIWADVAALLIRRARKLYSDTDLVGLDLKNTVYALDATTIDLCLSLFHWAPFRKAKGAVKLHTLLDLRGAIPAFIHISDGKMHEVNVLDFLPIEAGAFYVMDRGYLDFTRLYRLQQMGGFFVTCAKANTNARRIYSSPVDRATGLVCDQTIALNGFYATQHYPDYLRRIRFNDAQSGKTLILLTNNFALPPLTIAALYKNRWQVELFFKWIKQHLRIKKFLGNSENAVKTQIWCAVSTYVLIAIIKKELQINASLYTLLQILSVSVFEKTEISCAFQSTGYSSETLDTDNQLNLFGI